MTLKKLLLVLPVVAAALAWWIYQKTMELPEASFARVKRSTLTSVLHTNGKAEPIEWEAVRAGATGLVELVHVQQGQPVAKGDRLVTLNASGLQADLRAAEARAEQTRAELSIMAAGGPSREMAQIQSGLEKARFEKERAERDYRSLERLERKQAATSVEVAAAQAKVHQAQLEIEALERRRAALVEPHNRLAVEARLKDAQAALQLAQERLAERVIHAPLQGIVYHLPVLPGTYLKAGDLVVNIGKLDRLRVRVYVDEPELGRVAVGQPVNITWDALPAKTWEGTVERKPTAIEALGTRQVGEVLVTIGNPDRILIPGTNVNAEIRTNVVPNALTIPKEALRHQQGQTGVLTLKSDTLEWRLVSVGVSSVTHAEVLNGLSEGDPVALPTEQTLSAGERVKPVYR